MTELPKINCPACGTPMNHHCDKLVYRNDQPDSAELYDDGSLIEVHTCPNCGCSAERQI